MSSKVINLTDAIEAKTEKPKRRKFTITRFAFKVAILLGAAYATGAAIEYGLNWGDREIQRIRNLIAAKLTTTQIVTQYIQPEEHDTATLIRTISKELDINPTITDAIVAKESNYENASIRQEPKLCAKLGAQTDNDQMLCSSHGLMQILGIEARRQCKIDWSQLYDRRTNLRCGLTILKNNLNSLQSVKPPAKRLREALRQYNGSGPAAEAYADSVMGLIADRLLTDLGKIN